MTSGDHLFRRESGRMVAALTRIFGVHNLSLAEDVVQEAFCRAVEVWQFRGMPENPAAWLMATAKHCALDALRRERMARTKAPALQGWMLSEWTLAPTMAELFSPEAIQDDLLRMMFSCCHPRLKPDAQAALILNILCGFSVDEIAAAFVSSHAAIEKRITRSKKVLAQSKKLFDLHAPKDFPARLPAVHEALYLLFNEGYHGSSPQIAVRADLCQEAMRLTALLLDHSQAGDPTTQALAALMCLHAGRIPSRLDGEGNLTPFEEQDRGLWDRNLIQQGISLLEQSARGATVTTYHIEAAIAAVHAKAKRAEDTNWAEIVGLYDVLLRIQSSPVIELNRAIAVAQRSGPQEGLEAIEGIEDKPRLASYPFFHAAQGELYLRMGNSARAQNHFTHAAALARNPTERRFLEQRIGACMCGTAG
jgi:RNA polymerase sigma-70 factor (ECF subfamily)